MRGPLLDPTIGLHAGMNVVTSGWQPSGLCTAGWDRRIVDTINIDWCRGRPACADSGTTAELPQQP